MRAAKTVRWSHSHVVIVTVDLLGTCLQPLVFQIADSSGRQNTHFPCGVTPDGILVLKKHSKTLITHNYAHISHETNRLCSWRPCGRPLVIPDSQYFNNFH